MKTIKIIINDRFVPRNTYAAVHEGEAIVYGHTYNVPEEEVQDILNQQMAMALVVDNNEYNGKY